MEKQIIKLMETLQITREEAMEIIAFDKEEFELEEVQEMTEKAKKIDKGTKRGKKATPSDKPKMAGVTTQKRAKKENPTKKLIIETLLQAVQGLENVQNVENPNVEKTILFELNGNTFEIDLKQKRKPKQ